MIMKNNNENVLTKDYREHSVIISKPLSESEVIDLMIYGEDVIDSGVDPEPVTLKE